VRICFVFTLVRVLMYRALSSIQSTIGFAPQAEAGGEDVEMGAEGALPKEVEAIFNQTNDTYVPLLKAFRRS
jgi:hypothetical protein